ncbi:MAG: hypothetical protein AAGA99_27265 [Actinomycetota bacterium]
MPRTSRLHLVDRLLDGGLRKFIVERHEAGESYDSIAWALRDEHDVEVTGETLRVWRRQLDESMATHPAGGDA